MPDEGETSKLVAARIVAQLRALSSCKLMINEAQESIKRFKREAALAEAEIEMWDDLAKRAGLTVFVHSDGRGRTGSALYGKGGRSVKRKDDDDGD